MRFLEIDDDSDEEVSTEEDMTRDNNCDTEVGGEK